MVRSGHRPNSRSDFPKAGMSSQIKHLRSKTPQVKRKIWGDVLTYAKSWFFLCFKAQKSCRYDYGGASSRKGFHGINLAKIEFLLGIQQSSSNIPFQRDLVVLHNYQNMKLEEKAYVRLY